MNQLQAKHRWNLRFVGSAIAIAAAGLGASASGQSLTTAFTYQGQLTTGGVPATGTYDFVFRIYDSAAKLMQAGPTLCADNVIVTNGVFSTVLDFGATFYGDRRFLEIEVRADTGTDCLDSTGFTVLAPVQELTATPQAVFAVSASAANTATNAAQLGGQLPTYYTNAANLTGRVPTASLTGTYSGALSLSNAGNTLAGNGTALSALSASNITMGTLANARTTGVAANTANTLVLRDAAGNFSAGTITAALNGNSATSSNANSAANATNLNGQPASFYTNAANISTGTLSNAVTTGTASNVPNTLVLRDAAGAIAAASFSGSGSALTNLSAGNIATGSLADARLSSNVALLASSQTFSGVPAFNGGTASSAPFSVDSNFTVANLSADYLDGISSEQFVRGDANPIVLANPVRFPDGSTQSSASPWSVTVPVAGTEALDQSMTTTLNTGIGMLNSWQSFTAGTSGRLTAVSIQTNGDAGTVSFNLKIYTGVGTGGTLLSTTPITLNTSSPLNSPRKMVIPAVNAPLLTAGQVYSFNISGGPAWSGIGSANNIYAGGRNNTGPNFDVYFKTFITTGYDLGVSNVGMPVTITAGPIESDDWHLKFINSAQNALTGGIRNTDQGTLEMTSNVAGFTGLARLDGTGAWTISSDRRLKRDIVSASGNLAAAMALRPVFFKWISEGPGGKDQLGLIAQEVREVLPSFVVGSESKGTLTVNYGQMSVVAIGAIQEQEARIEALTAENRAIKARLEEIEAAIGRGSR